jgi:flagellar biosynthesis protein FlhF
MDFTETQWHAPFAAPLERRAPPSPTSPPPSPRTGRAFRGKTMREALDAVKSVLGQSAILVSTREVKSARGPVEIEIVARPAGRNEGRSETASAPRARPESSSSSFLAPPAPSVDLAGALVERGMAELVAQRIVERAHRLPGAARRERDAVGEVLEEIVEAGAAPWQRRGHEGRRVVALVGPTGVGKTTTIAKMAARAVLDHKLQVALVTADTWRIGAVDHLRRYGEIMSVPTYVARDARALQDVLSRCESADLVLVDTAGRSPTEQSSFQQQLDMLSASPDVEVLITVAAGTSTNQLRAIRARYASLADASVVVTKLDEADGMGALVNVSAVLSRPIVCFTDGQRVPEDLHPLVPHEVVSALLQNIATDPIVS